jgi:hypothetical protein
MYKCATPTFNPAAWNTEQILVDFKICLATMLCTCNVHDGACVCMSFTAKGQRSDREHNNFEPGC